MSKKQKTAIYWHFLNAVVVMMMSISMLMAQIKITFPVERAIFQRNNANQATISIGGYYSQATDRVEARLVPISAGQGQAVDWTLLQASPQGGTYLGTLTGRGGWYRLEVRAFQDGLQTSQDAISRIGIGEVFLIAGQSNAQGFNGFGASAATDDRVNTVTWDNRNSRNTDNPILSFAQITAEMLIGPRGQSAWCWGSLGDLLARKLNVPILFMNTGWIDTSTQNWLDSAQDKPVLNRANELLPAGMPYANLKAALQYYGSILGLRAVLWMQGENDAAAGVTKTNYQNSLQVLINVARFQQGEVLSSLPWVFARTSRYASNTSQAVIDAQNAVINIPFNKSYAGPFTDNIQVPRPAINPVNGQDDNVHFQGQGLKDVAAAWDASLPPGFFATVVPVTARTILPLSITCNTPAVSFNAKAPTGFASYRWTNGETSQIITVKDPGTYQATMKDIAGNTYLTPPIVVPESVQPPTPVITPNGEQVICADSSLLLNVGVSSINTVTWSNGFTGRTISVKNAGTYTASLSNIYGCTSVASAPVIIKTLSIKAPSVSQSGPYSVQARIDSTIYTFADTKVSKITWDWQQGGRTLAANESAIKVTEVGSFSTRSRVTFIASSGGSSRTCVSPFSQVVTYQPTEKVDGLIVYPNPNSSGLIAIETLRDLTDVQITVSSLTGQMVYSEKMNSLTIRKEINLKHLSQGEYIFRISSPTFRDSQRIIIEY